MSRRREDAGVTVERDADAPAGAQRGEDALDDLFVGFAPLPPLAVGVVERFGGWIHALEPAVGHHVLDEVKELFRILDDRERCLGHVTRPEPGAHDSKDALARSFGVGA